jgi:hypothetical protein
VQAEPEAFVARKDHLRFEDLGRLVLRGWRVNPKWQSRPLVIRSGIIDLLGA